jgi:hypothetical protein
VPCIWRKALPFILMVFTIICAASAVQPAFTLAATLQLSWVDNSSDEDGFSIERKVGANGVYSVVATVGANVTTYADTNLANGTIYCYRVNAFNSAGSSPYSPEACGATPSPPVTPPTTQQFTLTINLTKQISTGGTGNGAVTSSPAGINCGRSCSATFNSGTVVTLTATPASGSTFAGWSGTGCTSGSITMNADGTCTATFSPQPASLFTLAVSKAGTGTGTVTSSPAGLNCGSTCSATFNNGTIVALVAAPAAGSTFAGWSGNGCTSGSITLTSSANCTATFQAATASLATKIGVFRPDTSEWFLDRSGNGQWDGCDVDICIASFGQPDDLPVVGSWSGNGESNIGTFNAATGSWHLDTNGNGVWNGCAVDTCVNGFGHPGDLPVTRELSHLNASIIGTFTPQTLTVVRRRKIVKRGLWNFDLNATSTFDGCSADECDTFGKQDALPVVGDWKGTGQEEIGVFLPKKGLWYLDSNGNGILDSCRVDTCLGRFGTKGDLPVAGDWDGTGKVRIGVFRPSTGQWLLDMNGNGKLDGCKVDACLGPFGQPGDLPVVGKW